MNNNRENPECSAFISLLSTNQRRIYGFIFAMVPNHTVAEDIMQETTLFMWEHFDRFQEETNFAAWGISIARNMVRQYFCKHKRKGMIFDNQALENLIDQSSVFDSADDQIETLRNCFKKLGGDAQQLLQMRYIQRYTIQKISENINRTAGHTCRVMAKIHNILLKCIQLQLSS